MLRQYFAISHFTDIVNGVGVFVLFYCQLDLLVRIPTDFCALWGTFLTDLDIKSVSQFYFSCDRSAHISFIVYVLQTESGVEDDSKESE